MIRALLALSLVPTAVHADEATGATDPCLQASLDHALPAPGLRDIPLDVAPVLVFRDLCSTAPTPTVQLEDANGSAVPADVDVRRAHEQIVVELALGVELSPESDYTLRAHSEGDEVAAVPFTTGTQRAPRLDGVPELDVVEAWRWADGGTPMITAEGRVRPLDARPGLSTVVVRAEDGSWGDLFLPVDQNDIRLLGTWAHDTQRDRLCVGVAQQDAAGRRTAWSDQSCAPLRVAGGCDTTSGTSGPATALLLVLAALARRPRRALARPWHE